MSKKEDSLLEALFIKLKKPLSERYFREEFSPLNYENRLKALQENKNPKLSAVLILIYDKEGEWHFPLMKRSDYGPHKGQISLPGGKKENSDHNLQETALRETNEELGIDLNQVKVIGQLNDVYIPPSKFLVTPFVGIFQNTSIVFNPSEDEVQELIEVPLSSLLTEKNFKQGSVPIAPNLNVKTKYFHLKNHIVWGATAIILNEFKQIIQDDL